MIDQDLIDLGFEKTVVLPTESGYHEEFYYYTLNIGEICLISSSNDVDERFSVWFFNHNNPRFTNKDNLKTLIEVLKANSY